MSINPVGKQKYSVLYRSQFCF